MSMMDGIKNRFRVGGLDEDDEDFDDYDDMDDEFEEDEERSGGFFSGLFGRKRYDDEEDELEEQEAPSEPVRDTSFKRYTPVSKAEKPSETRRTAESTKAFAGPAPVEKRQAQESSNTRTGGARVIPMSKAVGNTNSMTKLNAELYMIKPKTEEDARIAVDHLLSGKVVIINLEGLNLEIAQYVTDFVTGANYSIGGNFSTINSQVLVFAPSGINMTGAFDEGQNDSTRDF